LGVCPEWLEEELRAALHRDGRALLEGLLNDPQLFPDREPARPLEKRYAKRLLSIQTLFGPVSLRRSYYHHVPSAHGRCPLDERLSLVGAFSPAVARLMCEAAVRSASYAQAAQDLHLYSGLEIETRAFDRLAGRVAGTLAAALESLPAVDPLEPIPIFYAAADGTGVQMRAAELVGRAGRQPDGSAKTREAKLGCVFTQTILDEQGQPVRDPDSTSYVGAFSGSSDLGILLRQEAVRRGLGRAQQVVFLGDGAAWVWEIARLNFPQAVQILDFYHAAEYVVELAGLLFGPEEAKRLDQPSRWLERMKQTDPREMLEEGRSLLAKGSFSPEQSTAIQANLAYFENQAERTSYGKFRAQGYFIGSGVIEAGCKCVIARRLKQSGMFWSETGAQNVLGLRCLVLGPYHGAAWAAHPQIIAKRRVKARRWHSPESAAAA
jgi:hypothetical protein